jgi:hypothetical protein
MLDIENWNALFAAGVSCWGLAIVLLAEATKPIKQKEDGNGKIP